MLKPGLAPHNPGLPPRGHTATDPASSVGQPHPENRRFTAWLSQLSSEEGWSPNSLDSLDPQ